MTPPGVHAKPWPRSEPQRQTSHSGWRRWKQLQLSGLSPGGVRSMSCLDADKRRPGCGRALPVAGGDVEWGVQQLCNMVAELRLRDPRLVLTWKVIWSVVDAAGYCVPPPEVVDWAFRTAEEAPIADLTDAVLASCSAAGPRAEQERLL